MKQNLKILFALLLLNTGCLFSQQTSYDESAAPTIDGKINDAEWRGAKVFTDFYITIPKSNEKYYDSTVVFIRQTSDALYFAFKFWPKGQVISKSLVRDRSTDEENEFFILLDMENKGQNGYFFSFSFLNNQRDAIIYNQRNMSNEWDWVWENKSTIFSEAKDGKPGYIETEIKIPVEKMQNKNTKQIGIALQLFAYKPDGTSYWYSNDPNMDLLSLKSTYKLDIIKPFKEKLNLDVSLAPFTVGTLFNGIKPKASVGGDLNISYEKHRLRATIFTDQSTLEADPFRFSFYNRPIYLSEKRPFFSKDLDIYNTPLTLFYTRAIDSIDYGANYTFRSNNLKAGIVYVNEPKFDIDDSLHSKSKEYFAARPNFNLKDFNIGGMFLYINDKLTHTIEKAFSIDGKFNLPSRFKFVPQYIRSYSNGIAGNAYSMHLYYEFDNSGGPFGDLTYSRYDSNYNVSTAFNDYVNNYDNFYAGFGYNFRRNSKTFSDINVQGSYSRSRRLSDNFVYSEGPSLSLFYKVNGWLSVNHSIEYNRPNDLDANNNLIKHVNILADNNIKILLGSNAIYLGYYTGKYFGTFLKNPYATFDLSITNRLSLYLTYNYRELFEIRQSIYSAKLDYKVMDKLYVRSFFQKDTYRKLALWNTMVQYEFFAGSSAYFVLNLEGEKLQNTRRFFKVGYEFNF